MRIFGIKWAVLFFTFIASAQASIPDRGAPLYRVGDEAAVQGLVRFEKRHTVVPLSICQSWDRCPHSRPYWVVVLTSSDSQYEIDRPFSVGEENPPQILRMNGVDMKPGNVVRLNATVEYASADYYILGSIRDVGAVLTFGDDLSSTISLKNWNCSGTLDGKAEIGVTVSQAITPEDRGNIYRMLLTDTEQTEEGPRVYHLATLNDAVGRRDGDKLVYEGRDNYNSIQLTLSAAEGSDRDVPSKIKFSITKAVEENPGFPSNSEVDVVCNTIR